MFNPAESDSAFAQHLRRMRGLHDKFDAVASHPDLPQWLEYWNDAESAAANLRRFEHWLQRAGTLG